MTAPLAVPGARQLHSTPVCGRVGTSGGSSVASRMEAPALYTLSLESRSPTTALAS